MPCGNGMSRGIAGVFVQADRLSGMNSSEVPADIAKIAEYLARWAEGYGGELKWNEHAKLKASIMNEPTRWSPARISPKAFEAACREAGLSAEDTATVTEYLGKVQAGRRIVAHKQYRDFAFALPIGSVN